MRFLNGLLGAVTNWNDLLKEGGKLGGSQWSGWLPNLMNTLSTVLWVLLALVGAAGGIYALYVGIKMARADSAEQRDENKKRLINIVVSIVVVIALIMFFNLFLPMILDAFGVFNKATDPNNKAPNGNEQSVKAIISTIRCLIGR